MLGGSCRGVSSSEELLSPPRAMAQLFRFGEEVFYFFEAVDSLLGSEGEYVTDQSEIVLVARDKLDLQIKSSSSHKLGQPLITRFLLAALDPRDLGLGDARARGEGALGESCLRSRFTKNSPCTHALMIADTSSQGLTGDNGIPLFANPS